MVFADIVTVEVGVTKCRYRWSLMDAKLADMRWRCSAVSRQTRRIFTGHQGTWTWDPGRKSQCHDDDDDSDDGDDDGRQGG